MLKDGHTQRKDAFKIFHFTHVVLENTRASGPFILKVYEKMEVDKHCSL